MSTAPIDFIRAFAYNGGIRLIEDVFQGLKHSKSGLKPRTIIETKTR